MGLLRQKVRLIPTALKAFNECRVIWTNHMASPLFIGCLRLTSSISPIVIRCNHFGRQAVNLVNTNLFNKASGFAPNRLNQGGFGVIHRNKHASPNVLSLPRQRRLPHRFQLFVENCIIRLSKGVLGSTYADKTIGW